MTKDILKLRLKWFHLLAKDFIVRYQMGVLVLVMFLPGVAIGDNFNLFLLAITKPLSVISDSSSNFVIKVLWMLLLQLVFWVWVRAQKLAIKGGEFTLFLTSLPITQTNNNKINIKLLLYANHLIWPLIFVSYFYLEGDSTFEFISSLLRNSFLFLLLFTTQYISLFLASNKIILAHFILCLLFLVDLSPTLELLRLLLLVPLWIYLVFYLLKKRQLIIPLSSTVNMLNIGRIIPNFIKANLHYQILFKSGISSTLFRLATLLFLIIGFIVIRHHFAKNNNQDLLPYAIALEALIGYFISGFFVNFSDQRKLMHQLLISLPVKKFFWPLRDILIVTVMSLVLHGFLFIWESQYFTHQTLLLLLVYHFILLLICYPIRILVKHKQTYFSFTILFIISAITIFNLS